LVAIISHTGTTQLTSSLKSNNTLTSLVLRENLISDTGATQLALSLKSNNTLTELNLGGNEIEYQKE
jgi:Ran GTPase-activating protein (RanGAP) involved in mRNA processing and transport